METKQEQQEFDEAKYFTDFSTETDIEPPAKDSFIEFS